MIKLIFQVEVLSLTENLRVMKAPPPYNMNNAELEEYKRTQQNWAKFVLDIGNGKNFINEFENTVELPGKITFNFYINFHIIQYFDKFNFQTRFWQNRQKNAKLSLLEKENPFKSQEFNYLCFKKFKILEKNQKKIP